MLDVVHMRGTPHEVETAIAETARLDGTCCRRSACRKTPDRPANTRSLTLLAALPAIASATSPETGAKTTRAAPVASQVEAHNLAMVRAKWNHAFLEELRDFPFGRKDDQVDALSRAFTMLTEAGAPARRISLPFLAR